MGGIRLPMVTPADARLTIGYILAIANALLTLTRWFILNTNALLALTRNYTNVGNCFSTFTRIYSTLRHYRALCADAEADQIRILGGRHDKADGPGSIPSMLWCKFNKVFNITLTQSLVISSSTNYLCH